MLTQIQRVGKLNGVIVENTNTYSLSQMLQESYTTYYAAKKAGNSKVVKLAESHLANVKKNPMNLHVLSEDLDVLKGLVKLGKDIKDVKQVPDKVNKSNHDNKPAEELTDANIDKAEKDAEASKESWDNVSEGLKSFRENAKSKVFYKELGKFNKFIAEKKPITIAESMNLYKASNSCLTHLTVELGKDAKFANTYNECTKMLASDNMSLLESIRSGKSPSGKLLENFVKFTNVLLESDTELDHEVYDDEVEVDENEDRMEQYDDENVIDSEVDPIDEDDELEAPDDIDLDVDQEDSSEDSDIVVDITDEELKVLKSILSKIAPAVNESETVEDEEEIGDIDDSETDPIDASDPDDESDELEEEEDEEVSSEDEELNEEDEEVCPVCGMNPCECNHDKSIEEGCEDEDDEHLEEGCNEEDELDGEEVNDEELNEEDDEEVISDLEAKLTESAMNRIKKCF